MSYSTSAPPGIISYGGVGGGGSAGRVPRIWGYMSADAAATVAGSDYFSDGDALGMKVGDIVMVIETDNSYLLTIHSVTAVTSGGAATVSSAI